MKVISDKFLFTLTDVCVIGNEFYWAFAQFDSDILVEFFFMGESFDRKFDQAIFVLE